MFRLQHEVYLDVEWLTMTDNKNLVYKELSVEEREIVTKLYHGAPEFVRFGPKGYVVYKKYLEYAEDMYNLPLKAGDVFVMSYPRSGTTWTQELVWLIANDLNYGQAATTPLRLRYQFLDFAMYFDDEALSMALGHATHLPTSQQALQRFATPGAELLRLAPSPRYIKTHMPLSFYPTNILDTAKVVYVARDPRDMAVSYYHFCRMLRIMRFKGTFKELWHAIKAGLCLRTPYFEHVKEAWARRHHQNMLFLFYEELSQDLPGVIERVASFLGKELTAQQTTQLCDHLSFESIKRNASVNASLTSSSIGVLTSDEQFIRKGKVGGWRQYFDEDMEREANEWIKENLRDCDLKFPTI